MWVLDDGEEEWCKGKVLDYYVDAGGQFIFNIIYYSDDGDLEEEDVFSLPLFDDYGKHELRFV